MLSVSIRRSNPPTQRANAFPQLTIASNPMITQNDNDDEVHSGLSDAPGELSEGTADDEEVKAKKLAKPLNRKGKSP